MNYFNFPEVLRLKIEECIVRYMLNSMVETFTSLVSIAFFFLLPLKILEKKNWQSIECLIEEKRNKIKFCKMSNKIEFKQTNKQKKTETKESWSRK